ncbi:MAG: DUF3047 domain-containing protein [Rhodoferax sp.]|uniref:DUF3047 domain-containing protein n=1 Tax=Rhodoferax sp. TaxID=50421 RepID=UPI0027248D3D|nr:DUF3047 domain-containing protein [Rhodoferax sp.]MDO8449259.1 DUF3047 domain-containing protein [Rhodoferax sp.]
MPAMASVMKKTHFAMYFIAACAVLTGATPAFTQESTPAAAQPAALTLAPFNGVEANTLHPAWRLVTLPKDKGVPPSRFELITLAGEPALQVSTDKSYGVLSHAWQGPPPTELTWRWRVDQPLAQTDIATRGGDDAALKVCVMFDQPESEIPFLQRAGLTLTRSVTGQDLPNATLCYIWDQRYPQGTAGVNPYTARVRYIVLGGPNAPTGQWSTQRRRVADDFQRLFGRESKSTPPVSAVAVGADSDNTQGHSLAYLGRLRWLP